MQNNLQNIIRRVSGNNRFQKRMLLNFLIKWVIAAMILFSLNFFYIVPEFKCTNEEMKGFEKCSDYVCSFEDEELWKNHLIQPLPKSISLDYGVIMVCSKEWISSLLQSFSYIGSFAGYFLMPLIADNKGRKIAELLSWTMAVLGCLILLVAPNLVFIAIGTLMMGFGANGAITLHYSFIKELMIPQLSQRMMIFLQASFSLGIFLIALWSWVISDWKLVLGINIGIPSILLFLIGDWIEETPQFTLSKGQNYLIKSMNKIAVMNKAPLITQKDVEQVILSSQGAKGLSITFLDLFRYNSLFKLTLLCSFINFIIEFTFDGTILSLSKIGINAYLDQIFIGILEVFAAFFATFIVVKVQRKKYCQWSFALISLWTAVLGLLSVIENHEADKIDAVSILKMIVLGLLRLTLNCVWGIFFVFIAELYPCEITSVSFGWVSIVGNVGAIISPFIRLATVEFTLFLMSFLNGGCIFLIRALNETKGKQIKSRIQERQQNRKRKSSKEESLLETQSYHQQV